MQVNSPSKAHPNKSSKPASAAGILHPGEAGIPPLGSTTSIAAKQVQNGGKSQAKGNAVSSLTTARERRYDLTDAAKLLLPNDARVQVCMALKPAAGAAEIMVDREAGKGHVRGVLCCGDLWGCAVCAERITAYRRDELRRALELAKAKGWTVGLMTLTAAHYTNTNLSEHLDAFLLGLRRFMGDGSVKRLKSEYGWVGYSRSLEDTYNVNGHNPHSHAVVFFDRELTPGNISGLEIALAKIWRRVLQKRGLTASVQHGLKLTTAESEVQDYVAKHGAELSSWDAADEMTRHMHKRGPKDLQGRKKGFTPWELLTMSRWGADDERFFGEAALIGSPKKASRLFQQYYAAFSGRNQLVWSPGLRGLLGLGDELTDEQIAETEPTDNYECAMSLERSAYNRVRAAGKIGLLIDLCIADRMDEAAYLLQRLGISHVDLRLYDMPPPRGRPRP